LLKCNAEWQSENQILQKNENLRFYLIFATSVDASSANSSKADMFTYKESLNNFEYLIFISSDFDKSSFEIKLIHLKQHLSFLITQQQKYNN
jgi:hypothetical protein